MFTEGHFHPNHNKHKHRCIWIRLSNRNCNSKTSRGREEGTRPPLKSTSPFPSVSKMSMTRCTSGFCWSSGKDMNSSTLREPELSRSSFLNLFPSRLISSASTEAEQRERQTVEQQHHTHASPCPGRHAAYNACVLLPSTSHHQTYLLSCSCWPCWFTATGR